MDQRGFRPSSARPQYRNAYSNYGNHDNKEEENELIRRLALLGDREYGVEEEEEEEVEEEEEDEENEQRESSDNNSKTNGSRVFLTQSKDELSSRRKPLQRNPQLARIRTRKLDRESRPGWSDVSTRDVAPTPDMYVTDVNQTHDAIRARDMRAAFNEGQSSADWLNTHSVDTFKLTLKDLLAKGVIRNPTNAVVSKGQHLQFEASLVNEFEYKLYEAIEMYHNRIKWLLQGSRKVFGMVKGNKVAVMVDTSDANCGFGRLDHFRRCLTELIDDQLHSKEMLYFQSFATNVTSSWDSPRFTNIRVLNEARGWVNSLVGGGGCNLMLALKAIARVPDVDSIVLVLGSCPDQSSEVMIDYVQQLLVGKNVSINTVAYDCNNHLTNMTLRRLAEVTGGRYHVYASSSVEQIYTGTDITLLLREIKVAQDVINKIQEMRQGMVGDALVSILNEISLEVQKLPQSRFLPRPPNHTGALTIQEQPFHPKSSEDWLKQNGLKAKKLSLYQIMAPNAFAPIEEFIPVIRKSVRSTLHEKAMTQFEWHDGSIRNVHVDPAQLFDYQKQLGAIVKLYEKRVDWLSRDSRRLFGTITEKRIVMMVDLSASNINYLVHIQHSLRILLEQQLSNKQSFNIIGFGSEAHCWKPCLQEPTEKNLQSAWKWILGLECGGSRNFMAALRLSMETEEDHKKMAVVEGIYLFTSGIPDQLPDVICSYVEEASVGQVTKIHTILFNVDDYDSNGAIPGRYANITQTAECLRNLAHVSGGRFHWFRETGIIESDDIKAILAEMDRAVNYSQKCAMLLDTVKKRMPRTKQNGDSSSGNESKMLPKRPTSGKKALPAAPRHTELSRARMGQDSQEHEETVKAIGWRPISANKNLIPTAPQPPVMSKKSTKETTAKKTTTSVKNKRNKEVFYTEFRNEVGVLLNPEQKKKRKFKPINHPIIPDKEEQITTKSWLKKYGLSKLRLDLNKLVTGPDCGHTQKHISTLRKNVSAKYCTIFPSVNIKGTVKHLQLRAHELKEYEDQVAVVLRRYVMRMQWLLGSSRRVFGSVIEKKVVILVDTSGSMVYHMDELKRELIALIWEQLKKENISFNIIRFSADVEPWRPRVVEPTNENCHDAVRWLSTFVAGGNTCTLEALSYAFEDPHMTAVYMLTDGKPDCSTSRVLQSVASLNTERQVKINSISFNCEDDTANVFLKQLAAMSRGRYHRCYGQMDGDMFTHKLLSEGSQDAQFPQLPCFEGDDLRLLGAEINLARQFLSQSRTFRDLFATTPSPHENGKKLESSLSKLQPVSSASS
ncbi:von Willebrand factor A domain-containing protein 3A-like isoform X2 [Antedon mediterranea]|uniref:von Willebrand factor A domain-containing protein 3A-like isoform X2 n=1 Tax=Antedon mediterranea TaxID=105859 RepID=UPI003AF54723